MVQSSWFGSAGRGGRLADGGSAGTGPARHWDMKIIAAAIAIAALVGLSVTVVLVAAARSGAGSGASHYA